MNRKELIPITAKDFYLLDTLCKERFGEPLEVATVDIVANSKYDTNPKCSNCGKHFNGHFKVFDKYCSDCGGKIRNVPEPIKETGR